MAQHTAGQPLECLSIPIVLHKEPERDEHSGVVYEADGRGGKQVKYRCGFRIGGGIDQDYSQCPHGYKDTGIYVTYVYESGPAAQAGLQVHDKILQVNTHDFTMVTHKKAIDYIRKKPTLNMLIYRKGMPQIPNKGSPTHVGAPLNNQQTTGPQYQQYQQNQYSAAGYQRQY